MSKIEHTVYSCDKCEKRLKTFNNFINIVTSLNEKGYWSRLHVKIERRHGIHNDATIDHADLCRECTVQLLTDAIKRIRGGERTTAGSESIEMGKWGEL